MSHRSERLQELLRHEVSDLILREVTVPGTFITVLGVTVSPDGRYATVQFSVYPADKRAETVKKLERWAPELQHMLNKRLQMRPVPRVSFELDTTEEEAGRIDELLKKEQAGGLEEKR